MLEVAEQPTKRIGCTLRSAAAIAPPLARTAARHEPVSRREPARRFAKILAIGLWGTFLSMIIAAAAVVGFAVSFLLPLLGLSYLLFCLIALNGDRDIE